MKKSKNVPAKVSGKEVISNKEYNSTLSDLKKQIRESQFRAATAANNELIHLYWKIGKIIVERQESSGWGTKIIEKLAKDIQNEFPGIEGFSRTNVSRMRAFFLAYSNCSTAVEQLDEEKLKPFMNIPWGHNAILLIKLKTFSERLWYAQKTIQHGWSRAMLETWLKADLYKRDGKAVTNFQLTLPKPQSDLAQEALKDPYVFDFLTLKEDFVEKDLENGLVQHIQKFLLELGQGFSFMGNQYPIEVEGDTSYIDLLFYHVKLRCYVVIELKARAFKPEDAGQLNYYLSAVDDLMKHPSDNPTIGILLCKTKKKVKAEYAFRDIKKPMAAIEYEILLTKALPKELKSSLPTIKEIEEELQGEPDA